MKVLEKNELQIWETLQTCRNCHRDLLVSQADIHACEDDELFFPIEYHYFFVCPICGSLTEIAPSKIPTEIQLVARYRYYHCA